MLLAVFFLLAAAALIIITIQTRQVPKIAPPAAGDVAQVVITSSGFVPATLSIAPNTKVVWTNSDTKPHQIQANPHPTGDSLNELKSEILANAQSYNYTFTQTGSYSYHDYLNPSTNGTIEVRGEKK